MTDEEFAELYRQQRSALVWYVRCHGASPAAAADAVQDAFAAALQAADDIRDPGAWPGWLRTVALRCYLRPLARRGREDRASPVVVMAEVPDIALPEEPAADAEFRRQQELVLGLLARLPPQQRRVFALHYEGWSTAEIAAQLAMEPAAVRQNLARARAALRQSILQDSVTSGGLS